MESIKANIEVVLVIFMTLQVALNIGFFYLFWKQRRTQKEQAEEHTRLSDRIKTLTHEESPFTTTHGLGIL